jgi:hypothetical protein
MKNFFTLCLFVIGFQAMAQLSYIETFAPRVGLHFKSATLTDFTQVDLNHLQEAGTAVSWSVKGDYADTINYEYIPVTGLPFKDQYPGANMALVENPNPSEVYTMIQKNSSGVYLIGIRDSLTDIIYSPRVTLVPLPLSFGDNFTNDSETEFTVGPYTIKIDLKTNANVDAWGYMETNSGTLPVIRVKSVELRETSLNGVPFGTTVFAYEWLTSNLCNPLVSLKFSEVELFTGEIINDTTLTYSFNQTFVIKNDNIEKANLKLSIAPNPVKDELTINCNNSNYKTADYFILNTECKTLISGHAKNNEAIHVNTNQLPAGQYLVQIILDHKTQLFDIFSKE